MTVTRSNISKQTESARRPRVSVREIMEIQPVAVLAEMNVLTAVRAMHHSELPCLLVKENEKIVGIVTERDILRRVASTELDPRRTRIKRIMSSPVVVIHPEDSVEEALEVMAENTISRLPVVENGVLVGLVTLVDLAKGLATRGVFATELVAALVGQADTLRD